MLYKWIKPKIWLRIIKLIVLAVYVALVSTWSSRRHKTYRKRVTPFDFWLKGYFLLFLYKLFLIRPLYFLYIVGSEFFRKEFIFNNYIIVNCKRHPGIATLLNGIIFLAWVCEKVKTNIKIVYPRDMTRKIFQNETLVNITNDSEQIPNHPYIGYLC